MFKLRLWRALMACAYGVRLWRAPIACAYLTRSLAK